LLATENTEFTEDKLHFLCALKVFVVDSSSKEL